MTRSPQRLPLTIVIPTYNMAAHLGPLIDSFRSSGLLAAAETLFVDDGSTDDTRRVLGAAMDVRTLALPRNVGRFEARFAGAREVDTEWILFLDTRLTLAAGFLPALAAAVERGHSTVGWVDLDPAHDLYSLYWLRSHEAIFRQHYARQNQVTELTVRNYDSYLKGTTIFLCRTRDFLAVCETLAPLDIRSDDTRLMKLILERDRMFIDPALRVWWKPRTELKPFLARLVDRGPGFVEYHVFQRQGAFFLAVAAGLVALIGWIAHLFADPPAALGVAAFALAAMALSAGFLAHGWREWMRLAPLHVATILAFGVGVLYGLASNTAKAFRG